MTPEVRYWQMDLLNGGHETCNHKLYELSCNDYEELLKRSRGLCEVCGIPGREVTREKLFIDHDHAHGHTAVRGLICARCNMLVRDVDRGWRKDPRVTAYLANAWFTRRHTAPAP